MLRPTRWLGPLVLASLFASGCPSTHVRCQAPYEAAAGGDPLRCVLRDGGADAADVPDAPPPACDPDAGPTSASDPAGNGVDENCDGVDGVLTDVIFVAEGGDDLPTAGTTPAAPVRSLPFALRRAQETSRATILMQAGSYDSATTSGGAMPALVRVDRTVTLAGRYVPVGGRAQWIVRDATAGGRTVVTGPNAGAAVLARDVRLIGLELVGKLSMLGDGQSVYGLFAVNAPGLEVRDCSITAEMASPGHAGRAGLAGSDGAPGQDALANGRGGSGGNACGTTNGGGDGGNAGAPPSAPTAGEGGQTFGARPSGMSGPAATSAMAGGAGTAGTDGADGFPGDPGGLGFWTRDGFVADEGRTGEPGMPGTGGGGGGGGYTTMIREGGGGGGGGGGGCGGSPGSGGGGGGGSFGVYLYGASTTATFVNCSIAAGSGGRGGDGGAAGGRAAGDGGVLSGSVGGRGGMGSAGTGGVGAPETAGGVGGAGGRGGTGGAGGPGIGGPSVGVVRVAGAMSTLDAATLGRITFGSAGGNGAGRIDTPPQQLAVTDFSPRDTTPDAGATMTDAATD